ncbi:hypothetical protein E3N88_19854 [Mikania micrantha]|uniref:Uncharacterized protein n=1 Tax=Mikania micrantha TaxID=192012 RepID=A0A5N6NS42_9ASTR|nr:hypothetical protein E3N88_19854 [Mikania micrantha]
MEDVEGEADNASDDSNSQDTGPEVVTTCFRSQVVFLETRSREEASVDEEEIRDPSFIPEFDFDPIPLVFTTASSGPFITRSDPYTMAASVTDQLSTLNSLVLRLIEKNHEQDQTIAQLTQRGDGYGVKKIDDN